MNINSKHLIIAVLIAGLCFVGSVYIAVQGLVDIRRAPDAGLTVTGSATKNITSDLIVWRGSFDRRADEVKSAYNTLKTDAEIVKAYLIEKGVKDTEIIFSAVDINQQYRYEYNQNGVQTAQIPDGYTLTQSVTIESHNVDLIESISRDITSLIDSGVGFMSSSPEYYYTKLDELKLEMIDAATENAKQRAQILADKSGTSLGKLIKAQLGVFQITGQNSASDEYSSGGTYNTWSKNKTAQVTVKLNYDTLK